MDEINDEQIVNKILKNKDLATKKSQILKLGIDKYDQLILKTVDKLKN